MKIFKRGFVVLFLLILLLPVLWLRTQPKLISELDNTYYPERPQLSSYSHFADYCAAWHEYIDKRLGFREQLINGYQVLHDRLWHELVHPIYTYGRDGEVFGKESRFSFNKDMEYDSFHEDFVQAVYKMKQYCDERGIYFIFMMEPAKYRVLYDYLPSGGTLKMSYAEKIVSRLQELGVPCIDTYDVLREKFLAGEQVFNHQYDANHWNYLGAYYGVNDLLATIKQKYPTQHLNALAEFDRGVKTARTLPLSNFAIKEDVPVWNLHASLKDRSNLYQKGLHIDSQNKKFISLYNPERAKDKDIEAPKSLFFQGSYLFSGDRYILPANAFVDYTAVHAYQNILDFSYYVDIFKPDVIVFEQADYSLTKHYFDPERLAHFSLPQSYSAEVEKREKVESKGFTKPQAEVTESQALATVKLTNLPKGITELYLEIDGEHLSFTSDYAHYVLCGVPLDKNEVKSLENSKVVAVVNGKVCRWSFKELLAK